MRLIIEARLGVNDIEPTVVPTPLAVIDRYDDDLEQLGLSLAEGRELLAAAQSVVVSSQASRWIATQDYCHECYTPIRRKDAGASPALRGRSTTGLLCERQSTQACLSPWGSLDGV